MSPVYIWNIASKSCSVRDLPESVSSEERGRILRIRDKDEKKRRIGAKILLHAILERGLGLACPRLYRDAWGRLILEDRPDLSCGISHSGEYVMCGIGETREGIGLGVDIQERELVSWEKLGLLLAAQEKLLLESLPQDRRSEYLAALWVAKEAYLKSLGYGFSKSPSDVFLKIELYEESPRIKIVESPFSKEVNIRIDRIDACFYALCTPSGVPKEELCIIDEISEI